MKRTDEDCWDSGLFEKVLYPTAKKALDLYADKIKKSKSYKCVVDGYKVELIDNPIVNEDLFPIMWPKYKDSEKQMNIQIEIEGRLYIGGIFYLIKGEWIKDEGF